MIITLLPDTGNLHGLGAALTHERTIEWSHSRLLQGTQQRKRQSWLRQGIIQGVVLGKSVSDQVLWGLIKQASTNRFRSFIARSGCSVCQAFPASLGH
jgi:hypothetical protein